MSNATEDNHPSSLAGLTLGAIGVVYGDIGTSPLYAMKESFIGPHPLAVDHLHIFGVLSLIFWSLMLIVTVKYVFVAMRADNRGEGGQFAMLALIFPRGTPQGFKRGGIFVALALFGTALLYGDGIITPAISVLGAVEGLEMATPLLLSAMVLIAAGFTMRHARFGKTGSMVLLALMGRR